MTVAGAYGMGKTRLAAELARHCHTRRRRGALRLRAGPARGGARGDRAHARRAAADAARARRRRPRAGRGAARAARARRAARRSRSRPGSSPPRSHGSSRATRSRSSHSTPTACVRSPRCTPRPAARSRSPTWSPRLAASPAACTRQRANGPAARPPTRVDTLADQTASGRSQARALETELAGSVIDLQSTRERVARFGGTDDGPTSRGLPVQGPRPVRPRRRRVLLRSRGTRRRTGRACWSARSLLAVVGPSGSGKSSVVRAGLLPALAGGVLPGSHNWTQAVIRPGAHPLRELGARRAARAARAQRAGRRPVRGALHDLRGRARADRLRRRRSARSAATSWWSSYAPTSTATAPPTPSSRARSAPITSWSGRCRATSCGARSSARRSAPG